MYRFGWLRDEGEELHTSISLRASVLVTAMVGEIVCATATFGIPEMVMFNMDALAAARETAIADAASDDKYFPLRRALNFATTDEHCR